MHLSLYDPEIIKSKLHAVCFTGNTSTHNKNIHHWQQGGQTYCLWAKTGLPKGPGSPLLSSSNGRVHIYIHCILLQEALCCVLSCRSDCFSNVHAVRQETPRSRAGGILWFTALISLTTPQAREEKLKPGVKKELFSQQKSINESLRRQKPPFGACIYPDFYWESIAILNIWVQQQSDWRGIMTTHRLMLDMNVNVTNRSVLEKL